MSYTRLSVVLDHPVGVESLDGFYSKCLSAFCYHGWLVEKYNLCEEKFQLRARLCHGKTLSVFSYCQVQRCCMLVLIKPILLLGLSILTLFKVVFQA